MISCEEAAIICHKTQYKEATFWERVSFKLHLLMCKVCPQFSKKNAQLTSLCEKANLQNLTEKEKLKMKQELQKKI